MALLTAPTAETVPAARAALLGCAVELVATRAMKRRLGMVAETYEQGRSGTLMRAAEALSLAGAVGVVTGRRSRLAAAVSGAALLAGSVCTRFGVFQAGTASARDPRYTVLPQRERLETQHRTAAAAKPA